MSDAFFLLCRLQLTDPLPPRCAMFSLFAICSFLFPSCSCPTRDTMRYFRLLAHEHPDTSCWCRHGARSCVYLVRVHVLGLVVAQGLGQAEHKSRFPGTPSPGTSYKVRATEQTN